MEVVLPTEPLVLDYGHPERWWRRIVRRIPRPSRWAIILFFLAAIAGWWLWADHEAWVAVRSFPSPQGSLVGSLSSDRRLLFTGAGGNLGILSGPFSVFDVATGRRMYQFGAPLEFASQATFSPDGKRLVLVGGTMQESRSGNTITRRFGDGGPARVRLYGAQTGELIAQLRSVGAVTSSYANAAHAHFSPDGSRLVTLENNRAILYDAATGAEVAVLAERDGSDGAAFVGDRVTFSDDGSKLVVRMYSGMPVRIHSARDGALIASHTFAAPNGFHAAFSPDGKTLAVADYGSLCLIDAATGELRTPAVTTGGNFNGIWFAPSGDRVLSLHDTSRRDAMTSTEAATGKLLATTRPRSFGFGTVLGWSPDGRRIIAFGSTRLDVYDATTLQLLHGLPDHERPYSGVQFSGDGSRAVALRVQTENALELLDTTTWTPTSVLRTARGAGWYRDAVFVGGEHDQLLTLTDQGLAQLWHLRRPEPDWGVLALPHCWLAMGLTAALLAFAVRDIVRFYRTPRA